MSELKAIRQGSVELGEYWVYDAEEVDAAITELKRENAELKDEIKRLENVRKVHIESIESMCEGLKLNAKQICKTQRALWLARASFCGRSSEYFSGMASRCKIGQEDFYREVSERARRYMKSSYKCQAKAEEYK